MNCNKIDSRNMKMADLEFIEEGHVYKIGDRRLISVTQALKVVDDRYKVDPWYFERGRIIHLCTEYEDRDELDLDTVDTQVAGYVQAYVTFKKDTGFKPTIIEKPMVHPKLWYAGKPDKIGPLNGILALIDLKSGAPAKVDPLQGAAYWELAIVNGIPVKKAFDLYLKDDGTYKLEPIQNPKSLLPVFLAALRITQWKEKL
jgi:hypothetical protein